MLRWLPENVSTFGPDIDSVFYLIYYVVGGWFVLTYGAIILFLILYRRKRNPRATYVHGNTFRQYAWLLILLAVVTALDLWIDHRGARVWDLVKASQPPGDVLVQVTGEQFNWQILYPGPDGKFGTGDDLKIENELHVPVNKNVLVKLKSKDVIHSFFLPHLRLKQDAMPGREIDVWFQATKTGAYDLPCAELCGVGHTGMLGQLIVHSPTEYESWVKEQWPASSG